MNKILVVSFFLYIMLVTFFLDFTVDDAFITYRYSKNFANSYGLVYNKGERSEGYTNFLMVLICAFFEYLHINIEYSTKIMNIFLGILTIFVLNQLSNKFLKNSFLPSFFLSITPGFVIWTAGGLETILYIFLMIVSFFLLLCEIEKKKFSYSSLFFLLLSLTRVEGIIFFLFALIYKSTIKGYYRRYWKKEMLFLIFYCFYFIFRVFYFGLFFPLTFYVKVNKNLIDNLSYILWFFEDLILPFIFILFFILKRTFNWKLLILCFFVFFIVFIAWLVGDWMPAYRLFLPSVPFLYILSFYFLEKVTIRKPFFILILLLTFFFLIYQNYVIHSQIRSYVNVFKTYKSLGKWYSHNLPLNSTLALCRIGNIGYYSNMRIIDLVGLTDKNIALNGLTVDYLKKENITYLQILSRTP